MSERVVETEFVFDRLQAAELSAAYRILVPERPSRSVRAGQEASRADEQRSNLCPGLLGPAEGAGDDPIPDRSVRAHAEQLGLDVPEQWVFEDDGQSGASLVRPALERLRDLVCQVPVDVLLVYSPDRLARKYAYQALLIEEFAKAGTTVMFVKGPRSDSPEEALLVQFQGMIAEYSAPRSWNGPAAARRIGQERHDQRALGRPVRLPVCPQERACRGPLRGRGARGGDRRRAVRPLRRRWGRDQRAGRWLSGLGVVTPTGKPRWDRSTVWGMLRNPAYAGRACFGKTIAPIRPPGSTAPPAWPGAPHPATTRSSTGPTIGSRYRCPRWSPRTPGSGSSGDWPTISATTPEKHQSFAAARHFACSRCGNAYYRMSTRTTNKKNYYYRCLGSDYRYEHGRVCTNKPVRADYLDTVVWNHITALLADPALIRSETNKRLEQARTVDPATVQRQRLDAGLAKTTTAITLSSAPTRRS